MLTYIQGVPCVPQKNFGKPVEWGMVKDHPWSTPQLRKLDVPVSLPCQLQGLLHRYMCALYTACMTSNNQVMSLSTKKADCCTAMNNRSTAAPYCVSRVAAKTCRQRITFTGPAGSSTHTTAMHLGLKWVFHSSAHASAGSLSASCLLRH